jgi:hypothetical protein
LKDLQVGMAGSLSCWRHLHGICSRSPEGLLAPDGVREPRPHHSSGIDVPTKRDLETLGG